jgi:hypothetical protein
MLKPIENKNLSLRARALFYHFAENGRVISADELRESKEVLEGRDALQAAINELKEAKYIRSVRMRNNGQWIAQLKFTEEALKLIPTVPAFSGHLYIDNYITTSDNTTSTTIDITSNEVISIPEKIREEENMPWNLDGEEEPKQSVKAKVAKEVEDTPGAVGQIDDRQTRLNAKYKLTKVERASRNRRDYPEEDWTTGDLIAEFYDLVREKAPGVPSQVNNVRLAGWINKHYAEGTPRTAILKAIRMFFNDDRLYRDAGVGKPLYQRFFSFYPSVHGIVAKETKEVEYLTPDLIAQQEKMLRLLGGE